MQIEPIMNICETGLASAIDFVTSLIGPFGTALAGVGIAAFVKNLD